MHLRSHQKKRGFVALHGIFISSNKHCKILGFPLIHENNTLMKNAMPSLDKGIPRFKMGYKWNNTNKDLFPTHKRGPPMMQME